MSMFHKASGQLDDPLADLTAPPERPKKKKRPARRGKKEILRAEELEKLLEEGEQIDEEAIISMYRPQRKARNFGAALLRLDKLRLTALFLILLVMMLFIFSFMQEKMGNFTINLNRLELYRKGISISADSGFSSPTSRLVASAVAEATNISMSDLPGNLDHIDGDHNGVNYMAYTYYVRNAGKEDVDYIATVNLEAAAKGAEEAVRVAIWRNGERIVYAEPAANGEPEEGCENFESHNLVCSYTEENFLVGNVDKYTIVIWLEGDDPECVDSIVGGSVQFSMDIHAMGSDDTPLIVKFVKDIVDSITGNKPINAAGNDAPWYYYADHEITYENRRNQ